MICCGKNRFMIFWYSVNINFCDMLQTWLSSVPFEYIIVEFAQCCPSKKVYFNFILSLLFIFLRTSMNRYQNQLSICFRVKNKLSQYSNFPCELNVWTVIARFMGPMWGPFGADRTQVGPMSLAIWDIHCWLLTFAKPLEIVELILNNVVCKQK